MADEPFDAHFYFLGNHPEDPEEPCQICASSIMAEALAQHVMHMESTMGYDAGLVAFHTATELLHALLASGLLEPENVYDLVTEAIEAIEERHSTEEGDIRHLPAQGRA